MSPTHLGADPARWPDPEAFRPERFLAAAAAADPGDGGDVEGGDAWGGMAAGREAAAAYMPFGAGPRVCLGQAFARIEVKVRRGWGVGEPVVRTAKQRLKWPSFAGQSGQSWSYIGRNWMRASGLRG
jgi:hypothetical protein